MLHDVHLSKILQKNRGQSRKPFFGTGVIPGRYEQYHWKSMQRKMKANPLQKCMRVRSISQTFQQQIRLMQTNRTNRRGFIKVVVKLVSEIDKIALVPILRGTLDHLIAESFNL
jgi:hypothetical protein